MILHGLLKKYEEFTIPALNPCRRLAKSETFEKYPKHLRKHRAGGRARLPKKIPISLFDTPGPPIILQGCGES
jgi:hypothetical protein